MRNLPDAPPLHGVSAASHRGAYRKATLLKKYQHEDLHLCPLCDNMASVLWAKRTLAPNGRAS